MKVHSEQQHTGLLAFRGENSPGDADRRVIKGFRICSAHSRRCVYSGEERSLVLIT